MILLAIFNSNNTYESNRARLNLALWEAEAGRSPEVRSSRPAWPSKWNPVSTKNTKISQVWWRMPVIPATQEAEAEESLEPGRQRLHSEPRSHHCTPAWVKERDIVSKKQKTKYECNWAAYPQNAFENFFTPFSWISRLNVKANCRSLFS